MEALAIITLATLALLVWKIMEVNEKAEQIDAKISNMDKLLVKYYEMLEELQPKGPVEIPTRLTVEQLKMIFKDYPFPEPNRTLIKGVTEYKRKKVLTENEKNILNEMYGGKGAIVQGEAPANPTVKEIVEYATKHNGSYQQLVSKEDKDKVNEEYDNQYGNEGDTFSIYEDEQLKKIRKHVQERKKRSLNK
jgi:hypothetical protein